MSSKKKVTIKQAIDSFLLSCKVEGKSYGTIECYTDKLKGFLWYATTYHFGHQSFGQDQSAQGTRAEPKRPRLP